MSTTVRTPLSPDEVASRLNSGSVRRSYRPEVAIDWDAPLEPGKYFLPPKLVSLHGTPYWDELSEEQRITLSREEMANILSTGIWFENVLNRSLLLLLMTQDPSRPFAHYSLTEMGDECRHMTMFGKAIAHAGVRSYRMRGYERVISSALPFALRGSLLWVGALVGEEIFDALQREMMDDPELQPYVSQLMRIHVTEEARHIKFAREGVLHAMRDASRTERLITANAHGLAGLWLDHAFTNPAMYRRAGLDVDRARREARASGHYRDQKIFGFASLADFLESNDLMGSASRRMWKHAGFLA
jgi:hypothetical protein